MTHTDQIIVDAHVHFHTCFDTSKFFDAAYKNFSRQINSNNDSNAKCILMLSESAWEHWFQDLVAQSSVASRTNAHDWVIKATDETNSLRAENQNGQVIYIIAGRQIVTKERLEVLALGTELMFEDGKPMRAVISEVLATGALAVIPWGFGKWLGTRGEFLKGVLAQDLGPGVFLGDNSGRISMLPYPEHFNQGKNKGIKILPGSDPLPFTSEGARAGSFGFCTEGRLDNSNPSDSIKQLLLDGNSEIKAYGKLESPVKFLRNQIRMQIVSRTRKKSNKI